MWRVKKYDRRNSGGTLRQKETKNALKTAKKKKYKRRRMAAMEAMVAMAAMAAMAAIASMVTCIPPFLGSDGPNSMGSKLAHIIR